MTVLDRLEEILTPERQTDEKTGLQKMLSRLETTMAALVLVKDAGFHAVVINRQRQPSRPAFEALRYAPILNQSRPAGLNAGFVLSAGTHFTLWAYLVKRSDQGQSAVWN